MALLANLFRSFFPTKEQAAEKRWTKANERNRLKGCPCGKPATISKDDYDVVGSVPFKWWTCDEH